MAIELADQAARPRTAGWRTPAVIVVGVGGYMGAIFGTPAAWAPVWWLVCYAVFVAFNVWGVELSFQVSVVITLCALSILVLFYLGAAPRFDLHKWALEGQGWLPRGWPGAAYWLTWEVEGVVSEGW